MKCSLWCTFALGGLALLVAAGPAAAQRRAGWGIGVGRGGVNFGYGYPGYGWAGQPGYGWAGNYGYPGYWGGYGVRGYGWAGNYGYSYPAYGYSGYALPLSGYAGTVSGADPSGYQSMYGADMGNTVRLRVLLPRPDARLWIDNNATRQAGYDRVFESPQLEPGKRYSYQLKAAWMDQSGKEITKEKTVEVTPGQMTTVRFDDEMQHDAATPSRDQREPTRPVTPGNPPAVNPPT